jgi:hypothetical protein
MAVQIQIRRDTASNWTSVNPILVQGEPGFETDTGKLKIGDGSSVWTSLPYQAAANVADGTIVNADINANAAIAVSKFASGTSRQILQTNVAGNSVEWTSDVSIPGTLSFPLATSALPSIYPGRCGRMARTVSARRARFRLVSDRSPRRAWPWPPSARISIT